MYINNTNKFYSSNIIKYIEYIFVICTILGNSVYYFKLGSHINSILITGGWIVSLFMLVLLSIIYNNSNYSRNLVSYIIFLVIFIFIALICFYLYKSFSIKYLFIYLIYPIMLIIYFCNSYNGITFNYSIFKKFEDIMTILAIISLVFYLLYYIGINPNTNILANWGISTSKITNYPGYFDIDFFPTANYSFLGVTLARNTGIFVEAPTFSYLLSVALFINIFLRTNKFKINYKFIVLSISIISTLSTTGIVMLILSLIFILIKNDNILSKIFLLILVPVSIFIIQKILNNKVHGDIVNSSYYVRHNNMIASVKAWHNHIIFGNGIGNFRSIYEYIDPLRSDMGITSTFFLILAFGGIILGLFYVIPLILSMSISFNIFCFTFLNFLYFLFEGIMLYKIFIIICPFIISCYLLYNNGIFKYKKKEFSR